MSSLASRLAKLSDRLPSERPEQRTPAALSPDWAAEVLAILADAGALEQAGAELRAALRGADEGVAP